MISKVCWLKGWIIWTTGVCILGVSMKFRPFIFWLRKRSIFRYLKNVFFQFLGSPGHQAVYNIQEKEKPLSEHLHANMCELLWPPSCWTLVGVVVSMGNGPSPAPPSHPQRLRPRAWHTALIALSVFCVKISPKPAPLSWTVNLP